MLQSTLTFDMFLRTYNRLLEFFQETRQVSYELLHTYMYLYAHWILTENLEAFPENRKKKNICNGILTMISCLQHQTNATHTYNPEGAAGVCPPQI